MRLVSLNTGTLVSLIQKFMFRYLEPRWAASRAKAAKPLIHMAFWRKGDHYDVNIFREGNSTVTFTIPYSVAAD